MCRGGAPAGRAGGSLDRAAWGEDPDSEGEGDLPTQCWVVGRSQYCGCCKALKLQNLPLVSGEGEVTIEQIAQ